MNASNFNTINIYKTQQTKSLLTAPGLPSQWQLVLFTGCGDRRNWQIYRQLNHTKWSYLLSNRHGSMSLKKLISFLTLMISFHNNVCLDSCNASQQQYNCRPIDGITSVHWQMCNLIWQPQVLQWLSLRVSCCQQQYNCRPIDGITPMHWQVCNLIWQPQVLQGLSLRVSCWTLPSPVFVGSSIITDHFQNTSFLLQ